MSILLKDGKVLYGDKFKLVGSDILIEDNKIVEVSEEINKTADSVLSCENRVIIPGLINSHTHASMSLFRGFGDGLKLDDWLEKIYSYEKDLTSDQIRWGSYVGMLEMIRSGITTFTDMYFMEDVVAQSASNIGMRAFLSPGISDRAEEPHKEIDRANEVLESIKDLEDDRINFMYGPHTTYTCSKDFLTRVRDLSEKNNVKIHIHLAETKSGREETLDRHDLGPVELLGKLDMLNEKLVAAHGVWLSDEEIDILGDSNANLVYNPSSNAKLSSGTAPINKILSENINVGLGTDGMASNDSFDIFEEMKIGALLQRVKNRQISAKSMFKMATQNGAKALGINAGVIEEGKLADLAIINLNSPNLTPFNDPIVNLVFSGHGSNVESVIIDGELIMLDNEILNLDESEIMKKVDKISEEIF